MHKSLVSKVFSKRSFIIREANSSTFLGFTFNQLFTFWLSMLTYLIKSETVLLFQIYLPVTTFWFWAECTFVRQKIPRLTDPVLPGLLYKHLWYEALQASATISVSQRWTNFGSMVGKNFWINFGTQSTIRHTAFRISKNGENCGL
jgi:hypothetical protein